jgi:hypothetical protein
MLTFPSQVPFTQWNSVVDIVARPPAKSFAESLGNFGKSISGKRTVGNRNIMSRVSNIFVALWRCRSEQKTSKERK